MAVQVYFERVICESELAWLVETADGDEAWLPKSECQLDEDDNSVELPEWLAIEKGLV